MSAYKMGKVTAVFAQGIEKQMQKNNLPMHHIKQQLDMTFDMLDINGTFNFPGAGYKTMLIGTKISNDVVVFNKFEVLA